LRARPVHQLSLCTARHARLGRIRLGATVRRNGVYGGLAQSGNDSEPLSRPDSQMASGRDSEWLGGGIIVPLWHPAVSPSRRNVFYSFCLLAVVPADTPIGTACSSLEQFASCRVGADGTQTQERNVEAYADRRVIVATGRRLRRCDGDGPHGQRLRRCTRSRKKNSEEPGRAGRWAQSNG
jgi:hypothetical protein